MTECDVEDMEEVGATWTEQRLKPDWRYINQCNLNNHLPTSRHANTAQQKQDYDVKSP